MVSLLELPRDIFCEILSLLDGQSLTRFAICNRSLYLLLIPTASNSTLQLPVWKELVLRRIRDFHLESQDDLSTLKSDFDWWQFYQSQVQEMVKLYTKVPFKILRCLKEIEVELDHPGEGEAGETLWPSKISIIC